MRKLVTVVAVVAALSVPAASQAALPDQHPAGNDGHEFAFTGSAESKAKITKYRERKGKFVGTLESDFEDTENVLESKEDEAAVCVEGRKVSVYKFRKHRADKLIGSDVVSDGKWSVDKKKARGKFYASVGKDNTLLREYYGGIDYYVACKSDTSHRTRV